MNIGKTNSKFLAAVFFLSASLLTAGKAYAMAPTLSLASNNDGDTVTVSGTGDPNVSVVLFYTKTNTGAQTNVIGNTSQNGSFSTSIGSAGYGIAANSVVSVATGGINGPRSQSLAWPVVANNGGLLSLTPTGLVLPAGQSGTLTAQNAAGNILYLSNNTNPPIANVNISGSQITVSALSNGSTTVTICVQNNSSNCASAYVTVQSSGASALSFSMSNVTVSPGQNLPITITGGSGSYTVFSNSNSTAIQTNISGSVITLSTNTAAGTSATSAITVCSTDMTACGIINASLSSTSSTPLVFSQTNPTVGLGQTLSVNIIGGTGSSLSYYVANNSSPNIVQTGISGNQLNLTGSNNGSSIITVCSSTGSCGSLTATVNYISYGGGTLQLSQSNVSLLAGQVLSVTVSGGTSPYNLSSNPGNIFQASLNGNIVTLSGIAAGSSTLNVCSAGNTCVALNVIVNASGAGTPVAFSQNSPTLNIGGVSALTITGSGGYYVSNSSNQSVASVQITGNTAIVTALAPGNSNISICQSGGQCGILFVTVSSSSQTVAVPAFSQTNPTLAVGQTLNETISGGTGSNYYIAANTTPTAVQVSLNNNQLILSGLSSGVSTLVVCATTSSCGQLSVTVSGTATGQTISLSQPSLSLAVGQSASETISGNGTYSMSSNSNSAVASVQINGNTAQVTALAAGNTSISICQNTSQCITLAVAVSAPAPTASPAVAPPPAPSQPVKFKFTRQLAVGSIGNDDTELQKRLTSEGLYNGPITGKFGGLTRTAVRAYQKKHGIRQTGNVGPLTLAALNQ